MIDSSLTYITYQVPTTNANLCVHAVHKILPQLQRDAK